MPLVNSLAELQRRVTQCDSLISNAHRVDTSSGAWLFTLIDRQQITAAAFLNLFIAWEGFLEDALTKLMSGSPTISGTLPTRYVTPLTQDAAKIMVIGNNKYFDYANIEYVKRLSTIYFEKGYPFDAPLNSISTDLADLKTMRNASAHITSTTQKALEALAQRICLTPKPGIDVYTLLTSIYPNSPANNTVYAESRDKLLAAATIIANG